MIKKNIYILILVAVFSCQSLDKPPKPEVFLEEDKMVEILSDIAFVKAAKTSFRKVLEIEKINPEAYILKKHKIDSTVFAQNNIWYASQLEEYEKIFTRVKSNLEASKNKYENIKKEEDSIKKIQDSIKKAKDTLDTPDKSIEKEIENAKSRRLNAAPEKE